jgi:molybdate transport system regulatory protein
MVMIGNPPKLTIKSKVWIMDEKGKVVFGSGRLRILYAIEEHGSILGAAKALGMSYRAVWGKIKSTEQRVGQPILQKQTGGVHGGGSTLTPFGRMLVERFRQLEEMTRSSADTFFGNLFAADYRREEDSPQHFMISREAQEEL